MMEAPPAPPIAKRIPHVHKYPLEDRVDPYHWLRDDTKGPVKRPDIHEYINAENAYTASKLAPFKELEATIFGEFKGRLQEDDQEVPYRHGPFLYYKRTVTGQQYPLYCRKKGEADAPEEVYFDVNELEHDYVDVDTLSVSPCHTKLAYTLDTVGNEFYKVHVKDLTTGVTSTVGVLEKMSGNIEWAKDSASLFYTTFDHIQRPFRLYQHTLGTPQAQDRLMYEEKDEKFLVDFYLSNSTDYIFMTTQSSQTKEVHFFDPGAHSPKLQVIEPRSFNHLYTVEHFGKNFLILSNGLNNSHINFRILQAPIASPSVAHWKELVPYDPLVYIENMDPFEKFVILYERSDALRRIRVINADQSGHLDVAHGHYLEFDENLYTLRGYCNHQEFKSPLFRFTFSSLVTPTSLFEYSVETGDRTLLKRQPVPNYDPSRYTSRRIHVPIAPETLDKAIPTPTSVPVSLLYRKDLFKGDGSNPAILYGYGSYGICIDPSFKQELVSYLDRGFVYAIANVRGGSECGRGWYETGKFLHKKNSFLDFVAAAQALVDGKITTRDKLAIMGRSAGGLLMGAVLNMQPDIARVCVAGVPFVDVLNTMMDASIPLTINELEEWGNPDKPEMYEAIKSYSPYDNIKENVQYPSLLIRSGMTDPRVSYHEPTKWTAKLRASNVCRGQGDKESVVLLDMAPQGHFGSSGRYAYLEYEAKEFAFVVGTLVG